MRAANDVDEMTSASDGRPLGRTVVVATDGTHDSDEAVRVGVEMSRRYAVDVQVISVVEMADLIDYEGSSPADVARTTRRAITSREGELAAQRQRTHIAAFPREESIHVGARVEEIVRFAEQRDASLIVMGAGSRGVLARLRQRQTATRVAAATAIPVLTVPSDGLPERDSSQWLAEIPTRH